MQESTETQSKKKIGNESLDKIKTFLRNLLP